MIDELYQKDICRQATLSENRSQTNAVKVSPDDPHKETLKIRRLGYEVAFFKPHKTPNRLSACDHMHVCVIGGGCKTWYPYHGILYGLLYGIPYFPVAQVYLL